MDATTKYADMKDRILAHLAKSPKNIVMISTPLTAYEIKAKHVKSFDDAGYPLFKANDSGLYMARGKRYECISYCKIQFYGVA